MPGVFVLILSLSALTNIKNFPIGIIGSFLFIQPHPDFVALSLGKGKGGCDSSQEGVIFLHNTLQLR